MSLQNATDRKERPKSAVFATCTFFRRSLACLPVPVDRSASDASAAQKATPWTCAGKHALSLW